MLARSALSEAAISAMPNRDSLRFAMRGEVEGIMEVHARLTIIADYGDGAIFAVEITIAAVIP